jgi:hypothetical protein
MPVISPKIQSYIMAFLLAMVVPGSVVATDGVVHSIADFSLSVVEPAVDSTLPAVQLNSQGIIDRALDRILGAPTQ